MSRSGATNYLISKMIKGVGKWKFHFTPDPSQAEGTVCLITSKNLKEDSDEERVKKFRKALASSATRDFWSSVSDGILLLCIGEAGLKLRGIKKKGDVLELAQEVITMKDENAKRERLREITSETILLYAEIQKKLNRPQVTSRCKHFEIGGDKNGKGTSLF